VTGRDLLCFALLCFALLCFALLCFTYLARRACMGFSRMSLQFKVQERNGNHHSGGWTFLMIGFTEARKQRGCFCEEVEHALYQFPDPLVWHCSAIMLTNVIFKPIDEHETAWNHSRYSHQSSKCCQCQRPPLVDKVSANFLLIEVATWSAWRILYGRILDFLGRSCYFFFQVAPQLYSRGWVDPVPFSENLVAPGTDPGPLDL
jgi:hypothetical protein